MTGFGDPRVAELLLEARTSSGYAVQQRIGRSLAEHAEKLRPTAGSRAVRVAVLSSFTIDPLAAPFRIALLERDVLPDLYIGPYGQFEGPIRAHDSDLHAFAADVCYLHLTIDAVVPGIASRDLGAADVERAAESLRDLFRAFRERSAAELIVANFVGGSRFLYRTTRDPSAESVAKLNDALREIAASVVGCRVLDFDSLAASHGRAAVADERLRHIARMELGPTILPMLAMSLAAHVMALRGLGRKCVVIDLDNTLWGGIVGEDGPSGIQLGPEYPGSAFVAFQNELQALRRRGILLAIASRNDRAAALDVIDKHPAMVLRRDAFAAMRINWQDKPRNLVAIAAELGLGVDSLVFIDDSPAERELMRSMIPAVLTPEWPSDPVRFSEALRSMPDFEVADVTSEDLARADMYAAEQRRGALQQRIGNQEDYLERLEMVVEVGEAESSELPRVAQLIQKTNQFNLTTRRQTLSEIERMYRSPETRICVLRNSDAFGDNGLVGVAIVRVGGMPAGSTWEIDSLLMSCRVLGRTIERFFLDYIVSEARAAGVRRIVGEYVPTQKNELVRTFYADAGFASEGDGHWVADPTTYQSRTLPWLSVRTRSDRRENVSS